MPDHETNLNCLVRFFETVSLQNVAQLRTLYAEDAYFKDPFNEVRGVCDIERIFIHLLEGVDTPRFVVTGSMLRQDEAFLTWDFVFRLRRWHTAEQCIPGVSHVRFGTDGRVSWHRDYWDATELYEKLPVLGRFMRWLKRMAQ